MTMQRKLTLGKGAFLWDAGDAARTIAVLDKGKLGVKGAKGTLAVIGPKMVFGESSLLTLDGEIQVRSAAVVALEDDTIVTEYPPNMVKDMFDQGKNTIGIHLLMTLIAQTCKNNLLMVAAHRKRASMAVLLKEEVQGLTRSVPQLKQIATWDEFFWTFRFLHNIRSHSDVMRNKLVGDLSGASEVLAQTAQMVNELFKGQDIAVYLDDYIAAERDKDQWLERERWVDAAKTS
jgi:CRP-like cAMP-binding protein